MRTIYLSKNFKCSLTENDDTLRTVHTTIFDGKCRAYIEGMRFIPEGESWKSKDGVVYVGEMAVPFVDFKILDAVQSAFEDALSEAESLYKQSITNLETAIVEIYELILQAK